MRDFWIFVPWWVHVIFVYALAGIANLYTVLYIRWRAYQEAEHDPFWRSSWYLDVEPWIVPVSFLLWPAFLGLWLSIVGDFLFQPPKTK